MEKVDKKWIQFLNILFLIQLERRWNILQDSLKNYKKNLKLFVHLFRATMFFLSQNRSGLLTKERLYSTSVETAIINGEMDKQRLSESILTHSK